MPQILRRFVVALVLAPTSHAFLSIKKTHLKNPWVHHGARFWQSSVVTPSLEALETLRSAVPVKVKLLSRTDLPDNDNGPSNKEKELFSFTVDCQPFVWSLLAGPLGVFKFFFNGNHHKVTMDVQGYKTKCGLVCITVFVRANLELRFHIPDEFRPLLMPCAAANALDEMECAIEDHILEPLELGAGIGVLVQVQVE